MRDGVSATDGDTASDERRRLIYVGGYGRSGSTLLGRVLAQRQNTLVLGEVVRTARRLTRSKRRSLYCTCGKPLGRCRVWRNIPAVVSARSPRNVDRRTHLTMLEAVMASTEHHNIVDSSKTALRQALAPGYLMRNLDADFLMIHLVRDPRGVAYSFLRDRVRRGETPSFWTSLRVTLKVATAWSAANVAAELFGLRHRDAYVRVRYEDALLTGVPEKLHPMIPQGPLNGLPLRKAKANHHAVAGNRMRYDRAVTIALDEDWREQLSPGLSALVTAICFPFVLRYRYGITRNAERHAPAPAQRTGGNR